MADVRERFALRKNPISTLSDTEAFLYFLQLDLKFGTEWLNGPGEHPLRRLWRRNDAIASMELLTLGKSINTMLPIASKWTERQIELAKSDNYNQSKGAVFEIVGLAAFVSAGHEVTPAVESNPGYDGVVRAKKSRHIYRISLKHHGPSSHEIAFREACRSGHSVDYAVLPG